MTDIHPETLRFTASDGWQIEGDLFKGPTPRVGILISAGTGFPRGFYRRLAAWLAERGAIVLTYDYRGIGGSGADDPAWREIDYPDWGRFDAPAALDALAGAAPGLPLTHVAHSVGGHFIGLMPNHARFARHAFVSVGTGYFGGHHRSYWPLEVYFWWGMGSWSLARHGFISNKGGWQGEPLPPKLFRTWRRWSHRRAYFKPDLPAMAPQFYAEVTAPIRSWLFTDDPIATPKTARDLLGCYPAAPVEVVLREPRDFGLKRVGHDGAFRRGREPLWQEVWDWLQAADAPAQSTAPAPAA